MVHVSNDIGVLTALMERLEKQRIPRALDLREKVNQGDLLDEMDTSYLEKIIDDAQDALELIVHYPEYQELYARVIDLYEDITSKALENERGASTKPVG